RRARTVHSPMAVPRIIEPRAEAGMRFQLCAVRHVNSVSRNIIDGGEAIVASGRNIYSVAGGAVFRRGVSERNRPRLAEQPLENGRRIGVGLSGICRRIGLGVLAYRCGADLPAKSLGLRRRP